ncbi:hypothetical protein B0H19DRAFT_1262941 [Mycena capillaripes]|nr:hypothetical protein B0H19DRAFT_1262941 [Mycena capillaripes]
MQTGYLAHVASLRLRGGSNSDGDDSGDGADESDEPEFECAGPTSKQFWDVPTDRVGIILDVSDTPECLQGVRKLMSVDAYIKKQCQDTWAGRTGSKKTGLALVTILEEVFIGVLLASTAKLRAMISSSAGDTQSCASTVRVNAAEHIALESDVLDAILRRTVYGTSDPIDVPMYPVGDPEDAPQFLVSGVLILPSGNRMCFMNVKLSMTTSLGYDLVLGCGMRDIIKYMPEFDPDAPGKTWETARTTMLNLYSACDEAHAFDGKNGWITIQI